MITFTNVSKKYGNNDVVSDVSFKINPGEFVSLVGKSGAGKSTLIKMLIGEEKPTKGRVIFGSYEVNKLRHSELPELRRHMGIIFQDFRLLSRKTAYENVVFAMEVAGRPQKEIEEVAPQVLELVGLEKKMGNFINELSGGERQRVAVIRALINHPKLLLADEPTGSLDNANAVSLVHLLRELNQKENVTLIMVTHSLELASQMSRIFELRDNKLVEKFSPDTAEL